MDSLTTDSKSCLFILLLRINCHCWALLFGFCPVHACANLYIITSTYNPAASQLVFLTLLGWKRPPTQLSKIVCYKEKITWLTDTVLGWQVDPNRGRDSWIITGRRCGSALVIIPKHVYGPRNFQIL